MSKRAVTYARVSGDDRGNDGRNLAGQLEMCREYAINHGYQIVAELAEDDRGASGATFELEQLNRVREMARNNEYQVLVVREIDRLSRSLAKQLIVEEELKRAGVVIEYVLGEYPDTPEGNFMKHVRASIAEFEREKIKERMVRGRRLKAKSGKWVGHCHPFGYKREGKGRDAILYIDEKEATIVRQIFQWFITEKTSLRQIAYRLTEAQVPIPGKDFNKPGVVWSSTTVRRILSNPSYLGRFSYSGFIVNLPELAIISEDDYNQVQDILNGNKQWQRKKGREATPGRYLLLDHFFCTCGYRMTGKTMGRNAKFIYYNCVTKSYPKHKKPCKAITVRQANADQIVWEWLESLLGMDEPRLRKGLNQLSARREDFLKAKRERLEAIEVQIKATDKKIIGLMHAFEGDDDEVIVSTLREQVNVQKKTKAELIAQRDRLSAELSSSALAPDQVESILAFAEKIRRKMDNANHDCKRELIKTLNVRVDLAQDDEGYKLEMSCDLPDSYYAKAIRHTKMSPRRNIAHPSWR